MGRSSEKIRNVALIGHGSSGKTALVDALALKTKVATRHGNSADGTSISNSEPEEKERKQTLTSHLFSFETEGVTLNVIDTPGHADFLSDAISSMRVVETGILCVSAASDVSFHARRLWADAGKAGIGRAIVVTHPDSENTDFEETLDELMEAFGDAVVPLTYPDACGPDFAVIHDVLSGEGPQAGAYRERLEERVAEADDSILEEYLENGSLTTEQIKAHMGSAISKGKLVPLLTICGPQMKGLQKLCTVVSSYFPSPVTFGPRNAAVPDSEEYGEIVEPDPTEPFAGWVFKVVADPYVGRMAFVRCARGTLKADQPLFDVRSGDQHKTGGLLVLKGKETEPVDEIVPGDLFVVAKLEALNLEDSLTAVGAPLVFPPPPNPEPTYSLAVTPKSRGDEQKINQGLEKLTAEDPTFRVRREQTTGELIVAGMSPLHLEVQFARLLRRYGVGVEHRLPTIPYQETVTTKADGHHRHKKQSGGRGQFGEVYLRVAARQRGEGFEFIDSIVGGSIPRQFIPEVEKGIRKFLGKGGLAGFPVVDVSAEIYDGKFHDVDSDQISFQLAGERGFAEAFQKAKPILLEPIMDVEIHVPERFTGDVAGNLSSSRGRMSGMEVADGIQIIRAQVPAKEMLDYSTQLRSVTAGEGNFTMRPSHYDPVPPNLQQEIVAQFKKAQESK